MNLLQRLRAWLNEPVSVNLNQYLLLVFAITAAILAVAGLVQFAIATLGGDTVL